MMSSLVVEETELVAEGIGAVVVGLLAVLVLLHELQDVLIQQGSRMRVLLSHVLTGEVKVVTYSRP